MILQVRVIPRARKTTIAGLRGDALVVRLAAPPVDGAANDALVTFLADAFALPRRAVSILSGHTSRDKRLKLDGPADHLEARLSAMLNVTPDGSR